MDCIDKRLSDVEYMRLALGLAEAARRDGEIAVGAIVVSPDGEVIGQGANRRESSGDATAHAETEAIRSACVAEKNWRLDGCTMYVTLEPCAMCAGAIINSRISRVVIGASQPLTGCCGSVCNLFAMPFAGQTRITRGVLADESAALLTETFRSEIRK